MSTPAALVSGIMSQEATWSVVAFLKHYLVHILTELAHTGVDVGGTAWRGAVDGMRTWNRPTIMEHATIPNPEPYRTTALHYVVSTMPDSVRGGRTHIPSIGAFMEAFVRHASMDHTIRSGSFMGMVAAQNHVGMDHVVVDLLRLGLASAFDRMPRRRPVTDEEASRAPSRIASEARRAPSEAPRARLLRAAACPARTGAARRPRALVAGDAIRVRPPRQGLLELDRGKT